jgi:probable phosphoglycerate mutase
VDLVSNNAFQGMGELEGLYLGAKLDHAPAGMEPISSMKARANAWWREAVMPWIKGHWEAAELGHESSQGRTDVLIVSHGGLIGVLLRGLCDGGKVRMGRNVQLTKCLNASITVIEIEAASGKGKITRYSDVSHLTGSVVERNVDVQDPLPPSVEDEGLEAGVRPASRCQDFLRL